MSVKSELRKTALAERNGIENKAELSKEMIERLTSNYLYTSADTVLCYASLDDEVSTDSLIERVLSDGKVLALPRCLDSNGAMDFYIVSSFDELISGAFGVREPDLSCCKALKSYDDSIIIVPGLCFDRNGYRLGYGKGYYDRFLQKHSLISIGLCYNSLIKDEIPVDQYDLPVDYIVTEEQLIACNDGGKNGKFE